MRTLVLSTLLDRKLSLVLPGRITPDDPGIPRTATCPEWHLALPRDYMILPVMALSQLPARYIAGRYFID